MPTSKVLTFLPGGFSPFLARVVDYVLPPQSIPEIQIVHRGKKSA